MAKNTYQTYTVDTPIPIYREDFIRRGALCAALSKRYPDLATIAAEADTTVAEIDSRRASLQQAEDDQIRARAVEDAEKLDVIDVYTELRRTMHAKSYDVATLLPDAPSALKRLGITNTVERVNAAISNLKILPEEDSLRLAFLDKLDTELADLQGADKGEDETRLSLKRARMALTLYKAELSQVREAEMGQIQSILKDREKTAMFTVPWRKPSKAAAQASEAEEATQDTA